MSAYGAISNPASSVTQLPGTAWKVRSRDGDSRTQVIAMYHLTLASAPSELVNFLHEEFADELDRGDTYPQETEIGTRLSRDAFEAYFFAADVLVGIRADQDDLSHPHLISKDTHDDAGLVLPSELGIEVVRRGRAWKDCIAGFYYVKPNYPGRSSHICNAGFVVPYSSRGRGFSRVLAHSYLYYAPRLGYQASVFNLVYVNNSASIRLWETLGFTKAGRIPRAGRLKRKDGQGEEYVDAWIFYKSFETETAN